MIECFNAESRYRVDQEWLHSRFSFSFGEYFDPKNTAFGVMRVCNDDEVAPGKGFGPHPHSDMEIVTLILSGAIRHEDNLGNCEVITAGEVQRMSAGSGIVHAEYNASDTEPLKLLQLWFMPTERGLDPTYETLRYNQEKLKNALLPVVTPQGSDETAMIHQDMTLYLGRLDKKKELGFKQEEGRRIFLFVIDGRITVNETELGARDTARIEAESHLHIKAGEDAFLMLIDLP